MFQEPASKWSSRSSRAVDRSAPFGLTARSTGRFCSDASPERNSLSSDRWLHECDRLRTFLLNIIFGGHLARFCLQMGVFWPYCSRFARSESK